jgi:hypothetical protein
MNPTPEEILRGRVEAAIARGNRAKAAYDLDAYLAALADFMDAMRDWQALGGEIKGEVPQFPKKPPGWH